MNNYKKILLIIAILLLVVIFSFNTETVLQSVKQSIELCYTTVIPSLFPFFVLSEFLISVLASTTVSPSLYCFLCGLMTGFPTGTKNVCNLYKNQSISKQTAIALLHCTSNASPAYLVSFIGICLIGSKNIGLILLISQSISALICAFISCVFFRKERKSAGILNLTDSACKSVTGSVSGVLNVCGYIIFMGVVADIILHHNIDVIISEVLFFIPDEIIKPVIIGAIEISRGVSLIDFTGKYAVITAALIVGFSGISVILQCISCAAAVSLPVFPIIKGKIIYSFLMPCLTYCLVKLIPITFSKHSGIFGPMIFAIFILFIGVFLYIIFDKSYKRMYNKEKIFGDQK